ncbi:2-oxo acid dehydrogenase subunit E2 [Paenarthrobacter sp. DKR-5]|uniref:dihydrolipoamide acetyltransferase family protein n=1 Tax=Paenarthrobacter sp. DKR-5 TaxID=2835535 RepID=UPI001BDBE46D|nr:dihydrolipoamide acetyltransferase family protein [Paenarthrobacter sp. DKR-5]MBT1002665.1 2-oxo acid dehydrogenase subunit E2 [Paenarthrobacter sp. DKR-5]
MIKDFCLPDLGEGLTESELVSWRVAVGETVALNQVIAEVETAKAVVELPSPFAGTVTRLYEQPGATVPVGAPIVSFEVPDDAAAAGAAGAAAPAGAAAGAVPAARQAVLVGYGPAAETGQRPQRRARVLPGAAPVPAATPASPSPAAPLPAPAAVSPGIPAPLPAQAETRERPLAAPPVRKLARDLGVDLASVRGTGEYGLITREDVRAAAGPSQEKASQAKAPQEEAPPSAVPRETRLPIKGVRKHTAAAMVASAFTAPHATEFLTVDVTATMELLERLRASRAFAGLKLTPLTIAAKALCLAVRRNPSVNSRWDEQAQEIVQFGYVNLGIAAATPRGLTVPNIKDADRMSLADLAAALGSLAETARAGRTAPADLAGGTISITNIGVFGIDAGTPILNPAEAAILATGAVRRQPWEHEGGIALRQVMTLSLSFDHRLVDGEQGSRFLADIGTILSDPAMVLTMV